jgi:hypothetical protein
MIKISLIYGPATPKISAGLVQLSGIFCGGVDILAVLVGVGVVFGVGVGLGLGFGLGLRLGSELGLGLC